MMRLVVPVTLALAFGLSIAGCPSNNNVCQKEFDCQKELKLTLLNDYVNVCAAERDGQDTALRAAANKECKDLADARDALATCESALSCTDLAKERTGGDTACKTFQDDLAKKQTAANGVEGACTAEVAGEGEGEGGAQ